MDDLLLCGVGLGLTLWPVLLALLDDNQAKAVLKSKKKKWLVQHEKLELARNELMKEHQQAIQEYKFEKSIYDRQVSEYKEALALREMALERKRKLSIQNLKQVDFAEFEEYIAILFQAMGYETQIRGKATASDGGVDVEARRSGEYVVVQCKRYGKRNSVGVKDVRELLGVVGLEKAKHGYLATTSRFTKQAKAEASRTEKITLLGPKDIAALKVKHEDNIPPKPPPLKPFGLRPPEPPQVKPLPKPPSYKKYLIRRELNGCGCFFLVVLYVMGLYIFSYLLSYLPVATTY